MFLNEPPPPSMPILKPALKMVKFPPPPVAPPVPARAPSGEPLPRDDSWPSESEDVAAAAQATAPAPLPPSDSTSSNFLPYGTIQLVQPNDPIYATNGVPWQSCTRCKVFQPFARYSDESCLNVLGIECIFESRHERAASSPSEPKKPNQGMDWSQGDNMKGIGMHGMNNRRHG